MGEECLAASGHGLQSLLAGQREAAMAFEPPVLERLLQVIQLRAGQRRKVEGNLLGHGQDVGLNDSAAACARKIAVEATLSRPNPGVPILSAPDRPRCCRQPTMALPR